MILIRFLLSALLLGQNPIGIPTQTPGSPILASTFAGGGQVVVANGRFAAQTAAIATIATVTPSVDTTYEIRGNVLVTAGTTFSFNVITSYTDEGNTARSNVMVMLIGGGSLTTNPSIANGVGGVNVYQGVSTTIRAKGGTSVTMNTAGTFTSVTYNVTGMIVQCTVCP